MCAPGQHIILETEVSGQTCGYDTAQTETDWRDAGWARVVPAERPVPHQLRSFRRPAFYDATEAQMSEEKHQRVATTSAQRQIRFDEIGDAAKRLMEQECQSRAAKTRRLRALRIEHEKSGTDHH
jgi:hypothetical protein